MARSFPKAKSWTEAGSLAEQIEFAGGQPHGLSLAYYPSGFLKARLSMEQGKVLEKKFWPDGEQKDPIVASVTPQTAAE
jgi:antitoxin component YwqK of YwqJK toxin-antitoxin module